MAYTDKLRVVYGESEVSTAGKVMWKTNIISVRKKNQLKEKFKNVKMFQYSKFIEDPTLPIPGRKQYKGPIEEILNLQNKVSKRNRG